MLKSCRVSNLSHVFQLMDDELSGTALGVPLNKLGNPLLKPTTSQS
jgi:hypothetical protein